MIIKILNRSYGVESTDVENNIIIEDFNQADTYKNI